MSHEQPNIPEKIAQGKPLRYLSVCSGMEAASVAWHPLAWKPVGFSEIEPFPCAILKHRFPDVPNYGSLTEYQSWPLEPGAIDLLVGGTPCQSFSVAGLRKGLADPRGNLALTFLGLADRLKPKWIVWENVPGVLSSGGGRDFGSFLGALVELGYGFAYRVLDAQHFGVPQRRRRVFVVACLGDWRAAAEVLSLREGLRGYLEACGKKRKGTAADAGSGVEADGPVGVDFRHERFEKDGTVGTIQSKSTGGYSLNYAPGVAIPLNQSGVEGINGEKIFGSYSDPNTAFTLETTSHDWSRSDQMTMIIKQDQSNAVPFRTTHAVVEPIAIQGTIIGRGENAGPQGTGATEGGPMFTLTKTDIHGVAHTMPGSVAQTVTSSGPPYSRTGNERVEAEALAITVNIYGGNKRKDRPEGGMYVRSEDTSKCLDAANRLNPTCSQGGTAVVGAMAVRRLTPVECERLQGFPDNWSRIPWKGKPETECPDGPRYKACGNSMAVPVMAFIGRQIADYENKL